MAEGKEKWFETDVESWGWFRGIEIYTKLNKRRVRGESGSFHGGYALPSSFNIYIVNEASWAIP